MALLIAVHMLSQCVALGDLLLFVCSQSNFAMNSFLKARNSKCCFLAQQDANKNRRKKYMSKLPRVHIDLEAEVTDSGPNSVTA